MSAPATAKLAALIEEDRQKRAARPKYEAPTSVEQKIAFYSDLREQPKLVATIRRSDENV